MSRSMAGCSGVLALSVLCLLASCATPPRDATSAPEPPAVPSAPGERLVSTRGAAEVMERGDGAILCVGGLYTASLPGSCTGVPLIGWTWDERVAIDDWGHRSGYFEVTGVYDPRHHTFTVREAITADGPGDADDLASTKVDFTTPCPEPNGGWRVRDAAMTTDDALQAVISRAESIAGHSIVWVDRPPMPPELEEAAARGEDVSPDIGETIVNVSRVGDLAAVEAELREIWGGMLCVTPAVRTAAEYRAIGEEIVDELGRNLLYGGRDSIHEWMAYAVVYDDGTLQREYDERYGVGVVRFDSALIPVD